MTTCSECNEEGHADARSKTCSKRAKIKHADNTQQNTRLDATGASKPGSDSAAATHATDEYIESDTDRERDIWWNNFLKVMKQL